MPQRRIDPHRMQVMVAPRVRPHELEDARRRWSPDLDFRVREAVAQGGEDARVREDVAVVGGGVGDVAEAVDGLRSARHRVIELCSKMKARERWRRT